MKTFKELQPGDSLYFETGVSTVLSKSEDKYYLNIKVKVSDFEVEFVINKGRANLSEATASELSSFGERTTLYADKALFKKHLLRTIAKYNDLLWEL